MLSSCKFSTTSNGAPERIAKSINSSFVAGQGASSSFDANYNVQYIIFLFFDFGYEYVFKRQIQALASKDDTIIGISTSGTSKNVIYALEQAKLMGCSLIGLSGKEGGDMNNICDINIVIPSSDTPRIQEMHIFVGHTLCYLIEKEFTS